jgi:hypothetical protein
MNRFQGSRTLGGGSSTAGQISTQILVDPSAVYLPNPSTWDQSELLSCAVSGTKLAQSSNLKVQDVVTTAGNQNLGGTLTVAQTIFTQPQELVTKAYVDTSVPPALGALKYMGAYNANLNVPDLVNTAPATGSYYVVSVAGTQPTIAANPLGVGDWVVRGPTSWDVVEDQNIEIIQLQQKTARLDANSQQTADFLPSTNSAIDIGEPTAKRFKSAYFSQNVDTHNVSCTGDVACQKLRANNWSNSSNTGSVELADTAACELKLTGGAYTSRPGQFLMITDGVGTVVATAATGSAEDFDVVPSSIANNSTTAASNDYYLNEKCPHAATITGIRLVLNSFGSDSLRVAVYRGNNLTAVLVGESAIVPPTAYALPYINVQLSPVAGQNLNFSQAEPLCIALALSGTTTTLRSVSCTADTSRHWSNSTDSVTSGFPINPRAKSTGLSSVPCIRILSTSPPNPMPPVGGSVTEVAILTARTSVGLGTVAGYNDLQLNTLRGSITGLFLNPPVFTFTVSGWYKIEAFAIAYLTGHCWLSLFDLYNFPGGQYVDEQSRKLGYATSGATINEISNAWIVNVVAPTTYAIREYAEAASPIGLTGDWGFAAPWTHARVVITKI